MKRFSDEDNALVARINVTPIIDVAITLVIILLITAPMITALSMELDLPQARVRGVEDQVRLSISLDTDGTLAVDDETIAPQNLRSVLSRRIAAASDENILVLVRADSKVPYQRIREVIQDAKQAGAKRIGIATRQSDKERM